MPELTLPETKWQRYNRGCYAVFKAYCIFLLFGFFAGPAIWLVQSTKSWPVIQPIVAVASVVGLFTIVPFLASHFEPNDRASAAETKAMRLAIDMIGERIGLNGEFDSTSKLTELLLAGRTDDVRQFLKTETGDSWDNVDRSIENWRETVTLRKVSAILNRLQSGEILAGEIAPANRLGV